MALNRNFVFKVLILVLLASCHDTDQKSKQANAVYVEYSFWGEEDKDFITGLFQFRVGGPKMLPGLLKAPSKVELDGEVVSADSAGISGTFYEIHKSLSDFKGQHTIRFTLENGEQLNETFEFSPFQIVEQPSDVMSREQMVFSISGLKDNDVLRVVLTDTSFSSNGINELDTIKNGYLDLRPKLVENIKSGPILLQIFKEEERKLRGSPAANGKIAITYTLKREFELKD